MTKKKKAARPASQSSSKKQTLRRLNREILRLCNERAELVAGCEDQVEAEKLLAGASVSLASGRQKGRLDVVALQTIFRELDSASRCLINQTRVAFLGPQFSYSHLAAIERFGQSSDLMPVNSIRAVFEAVDRQDVEYGIVPIENSTDGRIVDTLGMLVRMPARICGELPMPIHHNLLGLGKLSEIREVHSKPQALSQCRDWLAQHLPKVRLVASPSTTAAAESAAENRHIGAVASRQAGVNYGLNVLAANIEDDPDNVTRFAVIANEPAARTGCDKTSLMFELSHEPGALADAMVIFRRNRLNLTWIESFPKKGSKNEYLFFVELEGHVSDVAVRRAIKSLGSKTVRLEVLGSYPRSS